MIQRFGKGRIVKKDYQTDSFLLSNKKLVGITKIKINKKDIINSINNLKI